MIKRAILVVLVLMALVVTPAFASWMFKFPTIVTDNSSSARTYYPVILGFSGQSLIDAAKIDADGLNTNMQVGTSNISYMISTGNVTAVIPSLPANAQVTLDLYTGYSPDQTGFPIITGDGGYVTADDHADIELNAHFEAEFYGYINTENGSTKNLIYKQDAFKAYVSGNGTITASMLSAGDVATKTINATGVVSGEHVAKVTADGDYMKIYIDGVEQDSVSIAPVLINGTPFSTTQIAMYAGGRNTFYAAGRYWVFYSDNSKDVYFESATDGTSWGDQTLVGQNTTIQNISVWFDDTYAHYARYDSAADTIYYRRGAPAINGTIVWSAAEQTVDTGANVAAEPLIAVSTTGYPQIVAAQQSSGQHPNVWKSSTNNGTWSTEGGYPIEFWDDSYHDAAITALDNGKMYVVVSRSVFNIVYGALYDGSWQGFVTIDSDAESYAPEMGITTDGSGNAYLVYEIVSSDAVPGPTVSEIRGRKYNGSSWSDYTTIYSVGGHIGQAPAIAWESNTKSAYAFWGDIDHVYYSKYQAGVWSSVVDWIDVTANDLDGYALHSSHDSQDAKITVMYKEDAGDNYRVAIADFGGGYVPDNANGYSFDQSNVMPYVDYLKLTTAGTLNLRYEPNTMINGVTIPDRASTAQDGTIHWGTNSNIAIVYGAMESSGGTTQASPAGFDIPESPLPSTWFAAGENVANLPFYDMFSQVSAQTGQPVQMLYALAIVGLAFGLFIAIASFTRSALLAYIGMLLVFIIGSSMTIIPMWIVFVMIIVGVGIMYLYRQVAY